MDNKTPPPKLSKHAIACAAVFGGMMVLGSYQLFAAANARGGLEFPRGLQNFREGVMTQAIEKQLDLKMPARTTIIAFANAIRYRLVQASGEQVRVGKNGWLFLTDELRFEGDDGYPGPNHPETAFAQRIELIAEVSDRLMRQGVKLVVALVPDKARVYQAQVAGQGYPEYNSTKYGQALAALSHKKVVTIDLLSPFVAQAKIKEIYYRTDTHWNQAGAQIAAKEIAQEVQKLGVDLEKVGFLSQAASATQERPGDLLRLMGLEKVSNVWRPAPDREAAVETVEVKAALAATGSAGAAASLFGNSSVPVVLTGTSYSLRGNFHGFLQEQLRTKILNTAKDGGGFLQAMSAYLKDESFQSSKPKVLIWEVPERMLKSRIQEEASWLKEMAPFLN